MKTQLSSLPRQLTDRFYRRVFIAAIVALVSCLLVFTQARAQTTSLSIWPPLVEAMIQPGKSVTKVYRLKNAADATTVTISVVPFSNSDEFGHINLQFGGNLPKYFSLVDDSLPATLNLKAGETRELALKINVPEAAEDADYHAALVIESETSGLLSGSGSVARATIAAPILLTVSKTGTPNRLAKIEEFVVTSLLDSFDSIEFILRVKNQSPTRLQPIGQIKINNTFGRTVATLTLPPDNILGGTVRQLPVSWHPVFPLGRYSAEAELTPRDTTNTISQTLVFWVLPYKALLILGFLFFARLAYMKTVFTHRK